MDTGNVFGQILRWKVLRYRGRLLDLERNGRRPLRNKGPLRTLGTTKKRGEEEKEEKEKETIYKYVKL